jgi:hypothetical protein
MGNDTYRVTGNPNAAPAHDPKDDTVSLTEGPAKWFIKETDVPGIYKSAISLLTFTFNETRLGADPSDVQTYTYALK